MATLTFLREALTSIHQVGNILPAQRLLVQAMITPLPRRNRIRIIELGAGEGCITRAIIRKLDGLDYHLISIELNERLLAANQEALANLRGPAPARNGKGCVALLRHDAFAFPEVMQAHGMQQADAIISSLPLSNFPAQRRRALLADVRQTLAEHGVFTQYRHAPLGLEELQAHFPRVHCRFVPNLLPAWVYSCYPERRAGCQTPRPEPAAAEGGGCVGPSGW